MGTRRSNLDIFFHRVATEYLLSNLRDIGLKNSQISHTGMDRELYFRLAAPVFPQHTKNEQAEFYQVAIQSMSEDIKNNGKKSVFNMLYKYADNVLLSDNCVPICRYEKILNWRKISLNLGQDLFTCSFLAYRDVKYRTKTEVFSWPAIINTDNDRLHRILHKGMAENHFHLFGSSRTFELSWLALMNNENVIREVSKQFKRPLNHDVLERTAYQKELSWQTRLKQAAIIRVRLFDEMMGGAETAMEILNDLDDPIFCETGAQTLRFLYGYRLPCTDIVLDYALTQFMHEENYSYNRALIGERYFLYQCFKRVYDGGFSSPLCCDLLYLYLLIKSQFRGEMIQRNRQSGLNNFSDYQKRKDIAIQNIRYLQDEQVRLAVGEVVSENCMNRFEARIKPEKSIKWMHNSINNIVKVSRSENQNENENLCQCKIKFKLQNLSTNPFFVLHFPKKADETPNKKDFIVKCRNYDIRRDNKRRALAVAELLNVYPRLRKIIRGIDGCSNEIGCRPEVMAHEFRFLSNFIPDSPSILFDKPEPLVIKKTYHVGEDFMDISDGLRAIDEAIWFLGIKRSDRLGHALALGIDCKDYYRNKNMRITLKKQDLIDNICWLLCRSASLGITVPPRLRERLNRKYHDIVQTVYDGYPAANDMEVYYDAWHLRGDVPHLYRSGKFRKCDDFIDGYECWGENTKFTDQFRHNKSEHLYYAYHYDQSVRYNGTLVDELLITDDLIQFVEQTQFGMQTFIEGLGIGIETNPTSNCLIGPISRFDNHPLLRFYNLGLETEASSLRKSAQLFVSINTDDQGIFDTKLENEYAIMASALERATLPNGDKRYSSAQIYQWLDQIRQMGIEQSFVDW